MSEQPLYRCLAQQGEAFGGPGMLPRWTSSVKDAVGTAYAASSRIWFTCSHGIVNEIYHPTIDRAQVRDMEFLVTDGETFAHEEKRDLTSEFEYIHPEALGVRYINRDPEGRYALVKEIICDPHHSVVLQRVRLEGHAELLPRLKVFALLAPHLNGGGAGNSAWAVDLAGRKVLLAWKDEWSLMMAASCGFSHVSCGFVGYSDGWRDLMQDFKMDWEFGTATNGNVALMGQINLGGCASPDHTLQNGEVPAELTAGQNGSLAYEFTVAIGVGAGHHTAAQKTMGALAPPYADMRKRFIEQWHRAANPEWLAAKAMDGGKLMRASHNVLLAHEDKTYSGAFVASASIPWGQAKGDDDLGGYHLVWTRDMVQTASALLACGRAETARRALVYLACTQQPDGGFAQNFWIDGTPYWGGKQLDEVAFPIILAWRLWKANALGNLEVFPFVERASGCLVRQAPITHQERWEENSGYSPSTLAAVISGLICAAEMARAHDSAELAVFLEDFADWIEGHLEDWTVTNNGILLPEVKRHYMRIRPPECGEAYAHEACGTETIRLANRLPGTKFEFQAREIVDAGFLELVRYGIRPAGDPLIADSLKVVDAVLKRDLPQGAGWLRYNNDGYGQRPDGGPYKGWGQGRVWPLLGGERAHYELARGNDISPLIATYERFATDGQMMPEQVWDEPDKPERRLKFGKPAGSAVPLVWAHAEYLKLLRSAVDGKVFDRIDTVFERYCTSDGRSRANRGFEIYTRHRPIQQMEAGRTLRILDDRRFDVVWTCDGWQTKLTAASRGLGSAGFSADIAPGPGAAELEWTLHWPEQDTWLGYNVKVKIDAVT
ncbi:MAG TPA: glycoside hydrolase family 15 protein [Terracidiphilus sp.]|nr:glycoside hydrolase family 15 protein [Terracidiphilus sp.]